MVGRHMLLWNDRGNVRQNKHPQDGPAPLDHHENGATSQVIVQLGGFSSLVVQFRQLASTSSQVQEQPLLPHSSLSVELQKSPYVTQASCLGCCVCWRHIFEGSTVPWSPCFMVGKVASPAGPHAAALAASEASVVVIQWLDVMQHDRSCQHTTGDAGPLCWWRHCSLTRRQAAEQAKLQVLETRSVTWCSLGWVVRLQPQNHQTGCGTAHLPSVSGRAPFMPFAGVCQISDVFNVPRRPQRTCPGCGTARPPSGSGRASAPAAARA